MILTFSLSASSVQTSSRFCRRWSNKQSTKLQAFAGGLEGCDYHGAGRYEFDPLNFCELFPEHLPWYREAEVKHGRVAMLAYVGLVAPEMFRIPDPIFNQVGLDSVSAHNMFCGFLEVLRIGQLGFDFELLTLDTAGDFGLAFTEENMAVLKTQELKHGRLAMIAFGGLGKSGAITEHSTGVAALFGKDVQTFWCGAIVGSEEYEAVVMSYQWVPWVPPGEVREDSQLLQQILAPGSGVAATHVRLQLPSKSGDTEELMIDLQSCQAVPGTSEVIRSFLPDRETPPTPPWVASKGINPGVECKSHGHIIILIYAWTMGKLADETPDAKTNAATARSDRAVDRATSRVCSACLCIASGGALVMGGGDHCPHSAVGLAMKALTEPAVYQELAKDPKVNVLVLRAAMSTAKCRSHGEQFPKVVKERRQCQMIQDLETPWSVCDLEDVVIRDRPDRQRFPELEACRLRHAQGIYGGGWDIAVAAGDELLKALRRTALQKYPEMEGDDSSWDQLVIGIWPGLYAVHQFIV
ncbi:Fucoxanthin-chlorophyll a-c binding protein [Durusdinium trenchii]|uniref:Chloroplastic (FCP) n=1 Tax=Durusdinium trenchii TaxID=1381693 RepID=A0ABP0Q127_9DINO